jgi:hypothetical protein
MLDCTHSRRIAVSARHLRADARGGGYGCAPALRLQVTAAKDVGTMTVQIGSVSREAPRQARHPHLVPSSALARLDSQEVLHHIQFMMKKDNLGQDIMLMGPPGRYRRDVVRLYASLTNREVEYLAVSRDTTFSDLKQRREIRDRTAAYSDQCVVRAAIHGRILLLDGIEKAERNGACTRAPVHPCTRAPVHQFAPAAVGPALAPTQPFAPHSFAHTHGPRSAAHHQQPYGKQGDESLRRPLPDRPQPLRRAAQAPLARRATRAGAGARQVRLSGVRALIAPHSFTHASHTPIRPNQ